MSGFRTSTTAVDNTTVGSINITVPTGVVATDTIFLMCTTDGNTGTVHSATGATAVGMTGDLVGTSGRATLLKLTGKVAGDVITVTQPATGRAGVILVAYDNTVTFDFAGTVSATATAAGVVSPALNTTEANELVISFATGLGTTARSVSSVSPGTSRQTNATGAGTRFFAGAVSDQIISSVGTSGTVTTTLNGTLLGSRAVLVAMKAATVGGTTSKDRVAGAAVSATHNVRVAGTSTAAPRKVRVAGAAV